MTQQPFEREHGSGALRLIREGMAVYDRAGDKIGTVEQVHFGPDDEYGRGAAEPASVRDRDESLIDTIAEVFAPNDMPEAVRSRLLQQGFIRVDATGLFAADRYITPDQIAQVAGDRVVLRVSREELAEE